ncbi:unnamed protein product [Chondrus crispus]|uniref:Transmembrane protein n=1 Tax=Chondrus crispus TaxID=2769 RepID=R7QGM3_CHOCR|nr:unnamed protein product [Chondrus crispus]CDF37239.1 unnamed protein product [Chondrus crispus]|eukprot:XP_005717058.1 unnamed protein product [Chondrus crispus]
MTAVQPSFSHLFSSFLPLLPLSLSDTQSLLLLLLSPCLASLVALLILCLLLSLTLAVAGLAAALASLATLCACGLFGLAAAATAAVAIAGVGTGIMAGLLVTFAAASAIAEAISRRFGQDITGEEQGASSQTDKKERVVTEDESTPGSEVTEKNGEALAPGGGVKLGASPIFFT